MRTLTLALFILAATFGAKADTIYPFTGVITLTGPSVTETIDLSFDFDWQPDEGISGGNISNMVLSDNGPLQFVANDGLMIFDQYPYLALLAPGQGADIDLLNLSGFTGDTTDAPDLTALAYSCTGICAADFTPVNCAYNCGQPETFLTASFTDLSVSTPEPSTLTLLLLGIGLTVAFKLVRGAGTFVKHWGHGAGTLVGGGGALPNQ